MVTDNTKAVALLCGFYGKKEDFQPLSTTEYDDLMKWLISKGLEPKNLLQLSEVSVDDCPIEKDRLFYLLSRGFQYSVCMEDWEQKGIHLIGRSDAEYPKRLKVHLKHMAPPMLFYIGNSAFLNGGGLAIVGSRDVNKDGAQFAENVAKQCVPSKIKIVSGGAKGVDSLALSSSLKNGGACISIVSDNLIQKSLELENMKALASHQLLMMTPYMPNSPFNTGNAMGRNKMIYAMADYALVVCSSYNKGGTWNGAIEELRRENPIPVYVRDCSEKGNIELCKVKLKSGHTAQKWEYKEGKIGEYLAQPREKNVLKPTVPEQLSFL